MTELSSSESARSFFKNLFITDVSLRYCRQCRAAQLSIYIWNLPNCLLQQCHYLQVGVTDITTPKLWICASFYSSMKGTRKVKPVKPWGLGPGWYRLERRRLEFQALRPSSQDLKISSSQDLPLSADSLFWTRTYGFCESESSQSTDVSFNPHNVKRSVILLQHLILLAIQISLFDPQGFYYRRYTQLLLFSRKGSQIVQFDLQQLPVKCI